MAIDIILFYEEMNRRFDAQGWPALKLPKKWILKRKLECEIAEKIMKFDIIPVGGKMSSLNGTIGQVAMTHIYTRPNMPGDLRYVICPDTRVPNYCGEIGDALDVAATIGLKSLPAPTRCGYDGKKEIIDYIIQEARQWKQDNL